MVDVDIIISDIGNDHRFIIDGETVSPNSVIANFVHKPFNEWKSVILEELHTECNEDYRIRLSADESVYVALKEEQSRNKNGCVDISWMKSRVDSWSKLQNIFREKGNGYSPVKKRMLGICISDDYLEEYLGVMKSIQQVGFSEVNLSFRCPYFHFVLEELDEDEIDGYSNEIFYIDGQSLTDGKVIHIEDPKLTGIVIKRTIAKNYIEPFVEKYNVNFSTNGGEKKNQTTAEKDNIDLNNISIELPDQIDVGTSLPLSIKGISREKAMKIFGFEMDKPGIIQCDNGVLTALTGGVVEIGIKMKGKIEYVKKQKIVSVEHKYVQSINLEDENYHGTVGERVRIKPVFVPEDAENTESVRFTSLNNRIADVDCDGWVDLLSPGETRVRVNVGDIECYFHINAELKIQEIKINTPYVSFCEGETSSIDIEINPDCYTMDDLIVRIENSSVASYEKGIVTGLKVGQTRIHFISPNSNCEEILMINVQSNVYISARNALYSEDYNRAAGLYSQLEIEIPGDWEAHYFSVFTRAYTADILEIMREMTILKNTSESTMDLIDNISDDTERLNALEVVCVSSINISSRLSYKASEWCMNTDTGTEHLESRDECFKIRLSCMDYIGNIAYQMEQRYANKYSQIKEYYLNAYKTTMDIASGTIQYRPSERSSIEEYIASVTRHIREYEPEYNAPQPVYYDTTTMDHIKNATPVVLNVASATVRGMISLTRLFMI